MRKLIWLAVCTMGSVLPVNAQNANSMVVANQLGTMLGSEKFCGLSFDQQAIESYIEKNVKAEDMGFASNLQLMTRGQERELEEIGSSSKTAHCKQIARSAKANGFIKQKSNFA